MVTKGFKGAIDMLNNGQKEIVIQGPKGVGKSMALCAIAFLSKNKYPCLLYTLEPLSPCFKAYVDIGEYKLRVCVCLCVCVCVCVYVCQ